MPENEVALRDDNRVPVQLLRSREGNVRQRGISDTGGGLARVDPSEYYRAYHETIPANTEWGSAVHIDVGTDLQAKYSASDRVRAAAGFIITDTNIQIRFNGLTEDEIKIDLSVWGRIFELSAGDLGIYDIYIANYIPSGSAPAANVFVFVSG